LGKITILDLTEQACMGRQTFYYHFDEKYDLIKWATMTLARQGWDEYFDERGVYLTLLNTDIYINKAPPVLCAGPGNGMGETLYPIHDRLQYPMVYRLSQQNSLALLFNRRVAFCHQISRLRRWAA
jgi:hypothetical protein